MKISYGICCSRFMNGKYEILMVKKRYSYEFIEFVKGNYSIKNKQKLRSSFGKMLAEEKNILLSFNFELIYFYAFFIKKETMNFRSLKKYTELETKFINSFSYDSLLTLLTGTKSINYIWEFPKGRGETGESELRSAMRELEEETNLINYNFLYNEEPLICVLENKYKYVLYHAICDNNFNPLFIKTENHEIIESEWMSLEKAKLIVSPELYAVAKKAINIAKRNFKKNLLKL